MKPPRKDVEIVVPEAEFPVLQRQADAKGLAARQLAARLILLGLYGLETAEQLMEIWVPQRPVQRLRPRFAVANYQAFRFHAARHRTSMRRLGYALLRPHLQAWARETELSAE